MSSKLKAKQIIDKMSELMIPVNELRKELKEHQEKCQHPRGTFKRGFNNGNWCPQDDQYWIDVHCDVCFKSWTIDEKEPDYSKFTRNLKFKRVES